MRRWLLPLAVLAGAVLVPARPAQALTTDPSACDGLPGPAAAACRGAGGVLDGVGEFVGGAAGSLVGSALDAVAGAFAEAGGFFLGQLAGLLGATTQIDLGADWFVGRYALMFGLSAVLTFGLLLLSVVKAVVRGQGAEAVRAGTTHYLMAVVASAFAPALVYLLVQLSDAVTVALSFGAAEDTKAWLEDTGKVLAGLSLANPIGGSSTVLIGSLFAILCAVVLWVELLLRTAIIYAATLFAAPTFSGLVDRALWKHSRRWVYFTVSVIFAKPVVVAVLGLAAAGAGNAGTADGFSSVFVALALMLVAIFCVGLLFRIVPNVGDELAGALTARRELKAGTPNSPLPQASNVVRQSIQTHLVPRPSAGRAVPVSAGAAAGAVAGPAVAASVVQRATSGVVQGVGSAVRAPGSLTGAPTPPRQADREGRA